MDLLVLHDIGDPDAGGGWRAALETEAWPGRWAVPDLPGHGTELHWPGGAYDRNDAAIVAARLLASLAWADPPMVLGVGGHAPAAETLAMGGRASALVLVDGLGGPWMDADQIEAEQTRWLRAIAADPRALEVPPVGATVDPRIRHGHPALWDRAFAERSRADIDIPVLALETPASATPVAEVDDRMAMFGGPTSVVVVPDGSPGSVLGALRGWFHG